MTTPGERQFTALALLKELEEELPTDWKIGVLYDIACQLSRSVDKYDLLETLSHRVTWAVSVFMLMAEHRRKFIIDRQIQFLDSDGIQRMGEWIARRSRECELRMSDAETKLHALGIEDVTIEREWESQLQNAGDKVIESVITTKARVDEIAVELKAQKAKLKKTAGKSTARQVYALTNDVAKLEREQATLKAQIKEATSTLGASGKVRLEELRGDAYFRARINARALRSKIRAAVVAHKFERGRLERTYRRHIMDSKEHSQARDVVQRGSKGIAADVRRFNQLVNQMEVLIREGKAPNRREDPGLGPQDEGALPRWQAEQAMQDAIISWLARQRCREERERLFKKPLLWAQAFKSEPTCPISPTSSRAQDSDEETNMTSVSEFEDGIDDALDATNISEASDAGEDDEYGVKAPSIEDTSRISRTTDDFSHAPMSGSGSLSSTRPATGTALNYMVGYSNESLIITKQSRAQQSMTPTQTIWKGARLAPATEVELSRVCGRFDCLGEDVAQIATRTAWMSGRGLAVFAEWVWTQLPPERKRLIGHLDAGFPWALHRMNDSILSAESRAKNKEWMIARLLELPNPAEAELWLVIVHIEVPEHWCLLEVNWHNRELRLYDSFSQAKGYAQQVELFGSELLLLVQGEICETVDRSTGGGFPRSVLSDKQTDTIAAHSPQLT
ncbi:hypothetical protein BKA62DRAFT_767075 [Auriculariales sp. MPI-PUGE-AT-0066]|nr:hypothetical protein BKA62DRAFT_767075 [Auriculariales sp. MPI-PUGE-AT-0066]